jgi:hypothetical protein
MFNSTVLDVAIGLTFVYLTLALLCTALNEWWSRKRGLRGKFLCEGIHSLLGAGPAGNDLTRAFYSKHLIKSITGSDGHPSYISPRMFAQALVDALKEVRAPGAAPVPAGAKQSVQSLVAQMNEGPVRNALQSILLGADDTSEAALKRISDWFEDSMERVSGWYTRRIQFVTLMMALLVTVVANADTLLIVNRLWTNPTLRASVVARAQERAKQPPPIDLAYKDSSPVPSEPVKTPAGSAETKSQPILTTSERETLGELLTWSPEFEEFNKQVAENERAKYYKSKGAEDGQAKVRACLAAKETVKSSLCTGYSVTPDAACTNAQKDLAEPDCASTVMLVEKAQSDSTAHVGAFATHPLVLLPWLYWLIPLRIVGWVITIYAISLGAPFWFGVLQKLVNIRSAGSAPDEKKQVPAHS